jgi:hypothetical protein
MFDTARHRAGATTGEVCILAGLGSIATIVGLAAAGWSPTTLVHTFVAALLRSIGS